MKTLLFVMALMLLVSITNAETVTNYTYTDDGLSRAINMWRFEMVNTKHRGSLGSGRTFGAFFWCKVKGVIKYSYTYGELNLENARMKAAYAFDATEGTCGKAPIMMTVSSDRL